MPDSASDLIWFNLKREISDLENVLGFLDNLPFNLEFLFRQQSFQDLFQLNIDDKYFVDKELFYASMYEAFSILKTDIDYFMQGRFRYRFRGGRVRMLELIGFSGNSLRLKANLLNSLWEKVLKAGDGIVDFANNNIVKAVRKFLTYLNSMLGSLKELIPGVEAVKEFKECSEGFLDFFTD